mmetsp:Transcript_104642/g.168386  ORF Transcript_104642/g.168386 Transcript_104642/m.168386 type:complete len:200 (-) Transcript_104642:175-774(-)
MIRKQGSAPDVYILQRQQASAPPSPAVPRSKASSASQPPTNQQQRTAPVASGSFIFCAWCACAGTSILGIPVWVMSAALAFALPLHKQIAGSSVKDSDLVAAAMTASVVFFNHGIGLYIGGLPVLIEIKGLGSVVCFLMGVVLVAVVAEVKERFPRSLWVLRAAGAASCGLFSCFLSYGGWTTGSCILWLKNWIVSLLL